MVKCKLLEICQTPYWETTLDLEFPVFWLVLKLCFIYNIRIRLNPLKLSGPINKNIRYILKSSIKINSFDPNRKHFLVQFRYSESMHYFSILFDSVNHFYYVLIFTGFRLKRLVRSCFCYFRFLGLSLIIIYIFWVNI